MYRQRAGPLIGRSGFDFRLTLTVCGLSAGKEVNDIFGRSGIHVGVARLVKKLLAANRVRCPAVVLNVDTGQLYRHYITEISLIVMSNHNKTNNILK